MTSNRQFPVGTVAGGLQTPTIDAAYFAGNNFECQLAPDEYLFCEGDAKSYVYRLQRGLICLSAGRAEGPPDIVEIVGPGNFIGLGFLKHFIHSAKAIVDSTVICWPRSAIADLIASDEKQLDRQASATEREFAHRRRALVGQPRTKPLQRVAAFLVAMSRLNEVEGRDADVISDTLDCGIVSKYLDIDINTLRDALLELQSQSLIEVSDNAAIRIVDRHGLGRQTALAWQMHGDN